MDKFLKIVVIIMIIQVHSVTRTTSGISQITYALWDLPFAGTE